MNPSPPDRRAELAGAMLDLLLAPGEADASFRSLAAAAGVSRPTLVHHFGDRDGAVEAALIEAGRRGRIWTERVAAMTGPPADVLLEILGLLAEGWGRGPLARLHRLGLSCGLEPGRLGRVYLEHILEPTLASLEARLGAMHRAGELVVPDARTGALRLFSPIMVALIHQDLLGGVGLRPLDMGAFIEAHVRSFVAERPARRAQGLPPP